MSEDLLRFKRLSEIEHVLARSGMYLGNTTNTEADCWVVEKDKMVQKKVTYNPGLLKMFDEILSNSVDEHIRSGSVKNILVNTYQMTDEISVSDDGGIPVKKHPEYDIYIPEMIFSEFRTGSNFSDDERSTAGLNGLGSKLTSVFSKYFKVDTCDGSKQFVQVFEDNLSKKNDPYITKSTYKGTTITFLPDYQRLGCTLDEGNIAKIKKRVYDVAGCNPSIKVFYNGQQIKIKSFGSYVSMYAEEYVEDKQDKWHVALAASNDQFSHVSFVNGVDTFNGGTHVDYVANQICAKIREFIKKKHKIDVKPNIIKQQMFLFISCTINAPMFSSQTKECLTTEVRNYGSSYSPSDKFIKAVCESEVIQKVLDWVEAEKRKEELAELRKMNKQTQTTNFLKRIIKFDDASSKDRKKCTLMLTEGDSAAKPISAARGQDGLIGVYPLKGKMMNVRDVSIKDIAKSEEIQNIMAIIGLKLGEPVKSVDDLRFGKICIASDFDPDGQHIAGLFFNFINEFWPELFTLGVIYRLRTPLFVVQYKGKEYEFFDKESFYSWTKDKTNIKSRYFKGLGTFETKQFKRFLSEDGYMVNITVNGQEDIDALNIAFDKRKANERKEWLLA